MICPHCFSPHNIVSNTRPTSKDTSIWRRRKCLKCKEVFSTYENIDLDFLIVQKRDGRRNRYLRAKLFSSIYLSIFLGKHRDSGNTAEHSTNIIDKVEIEILKLKSKVVTTKQIIRIVAEELHKFDYPSYLRYIAYTEYRFKIAKKISSE